MLVKALKARLEKGPIDVVTGEAKYSLSDERLLRHAIDPKVSLGWRSISMYACVNCLIL